MKLSQSLKIALIAFVFLFAFSIGTRFSRPEIQHNLTTGYLHEEYGVSSFEELEYRMKLNYTKAIEQYWLDYSVPNNWQKQELTMPQGGTSTYQDLPKETRIYLLLIWMHANSASLIGLSLSGLLFTSILLIPTIGKKLLNRKRLIPIVGFAIVFAVGIFSGVFIPRSLGAPKTYFDDISFGAKFIVTTDGIDVWATKDNGDILTSGAAGTDDVTVINNALGNLTTGRTWQEVVVLKGNFTLTSAIKMPAYSTLDLRNAQVNLDSDCNMIENVNTSTGENDKTVIGGILNGHASSRTSGNGIKFFGHRIRILNVEFWNIKEYGIFIYGSGVSYSRRSWILNCYFDAELGNAGKGGVYYNYLGARAGAWIANNRFRYIDAKATENIIDVEVFGVTAARGVHMYHNRLSNTAKAGI